MLHFIATFGKVTISAQSQLAVLAAAIVRSNSQNVCRAAVVESAVIPWRVAWSLRLGSTSSSYSQCHCHSLHSPQTNRILSAHVQQNGIIPSTKEVVELSACKTEPLSKEKSIPPVGCSITVNYNSQFYWHCLADWVGLASSL